jgi:LytS/YehU family sensor histidine kinase
VRRLRRQGKIRRKPLMWLGYVLFVGVVSAVGAWCFSIAHEKSATIAVDIHNYLRYFIASVLVETTICCIVILVDIVFAIRKTMQLERVRAAQAQYRYATLKQQVNPHFLFNAMNNIYFLVYMKDKNATDAILSLSEMLRYVTNCSKNKEISLEKEIVYLENYIDFHRLSFENPLNITFEKQVGSESIMIAPMLLQPFLENSFKYSGVGRVDDAFIFLSLNATQNQLHFYIENTVCEKFRAKKEFSNGVGLQNAKHRLQLCYPNRYVLSVNELNNIYQLDLVINLI